MAVYTTELSGDFLKIAYHIDQMIQQQSMSISVENQYRDSVAGKRIIFTVYERYSWTGQNRASLSVLITETDTGAKIVGVGSGGSSALSFKINTIGEEAFLDTLRAAAESWQA